MDEFNNNKEVCVFLQWNGENPGTGLIGEFCTQSASTGQSIYDACGLTWNAFGADSMTCDEVMPALNPPILKVTLTIDHNNFDKQQEACIVQVC